MGCIQVHFRKDWIFPYAQCLGKVLMDKDWNRLNNLIYQENCFRSLCSLMCGDYRSEGKKFVSGKGPQWERATIAYLLAMYDKNPKEAGVQLGLLCKGVMRADFDVDTDKTLFVPAHGLYQLAACLWDKELFQQLPMPDHKIFSKEYAVWRNTQKVHPELFAKYPETMINNVLVNPEIEMLEPNK